MRGILATILLFLMAIGGSVPPMKVATTDYPAGVERSAHQSVDAGLMACCDEPGSLAGSAQTTCSMDCHYLAPWLVQAFHAPVAVKAGVAGFAVHGPGDTGFLRPPISV